MPDVHKMIIQINGMKYPITTHENGDYVAELGREIDKSVRQIVENTPRSTNEALVLLCLSYLDSFRKAEKSSDNLRSQVAEYLEEAAKARAEAGEARKEIARLENRLKGKDLAGSKS